MLQQTRVAAVIPYYERFLALFPTLEALAQAPEVELLRAWSGLGYYSRARNLQAAAKQMDGVFPDDYDGVNSLAGVGEYTAAAVASIAFGLPHAAVDGNVLRVLTRVMSDFGDISSPATRRRLAAEAQRLLEPEQPGAFNQAMMELGATVCLPRNPRCLLCPVENLCVGRQSGHQNELPVKAQRVQPVKQERTLLIIERKGALLLWQRTARDEKLHGFWELPEPEQLPKAIQGVKLGSFRHSIMNHNYVFHVVPATVLRKPRALQWLTLGERKSLPLSTTCRKALRLHTSILGEDGI